MIHNNLEEYHNEVLVKMLTYCEKQEVTERIADLLIELLDASKSTVSADKHLPILYRFREKYGNCETLDRANTIQWSTLYDALLEHEVTEKFGRGMVSGEWAITWSHRGY